jgi:hypothetical protein
MDCATPPPLSYSTKIGLICLQKGALLSSNMAPFDSDTNGHPIPDSIGKVQYHSWMAQVFVGQLAPWVTMASGHSVSEKAQLNMLRELAAYYPDEPDLKDFLIPDSIETDFSKIIERMELTYFFETRITYEPRCSGSDCKYRLSITTKSVKSELFGVNEDRAERPEEVFVISYRSVKVLLLVALEELAALLPHYKPLDSYR